MIRIIVACLLLGIVPPSDAHAQKKRSRAMDMSDDMFQNLELRFSKILSDEAFPDTALALPKFTAHRIVDRSALMSSIEETSERLGIDAVTLFVSHVCDDNAPEAAWAGIHQEPPLDTSRIQLSAADFLETLKQCDTPSVRLSMTGDEMEPILVSSGRMEAAIWPVLN